MRKIQSSILVLTLVIASGSMVIADWDPGDDHKMHWPQLPDLDPTGMDVCMYGDIYEYASLADDFKCTNSGPIADIHFWASFLDDDLPPGGPGSLSFHIKIHENIPAGQIANWSMPGGEIWNKTFYPGDYTYRLYDEGIQSWYCPWAEWFDPNNHHGTYQYNFYIEEHEAFEQVEDTIYWLEIRWISTGVNHDYVLGWKTTKYNLRWEDDACKYDGTSWTPLEYPDGHEYYKQSLDLSFVITGGEDIPVNVTIIKPRDGLYLFGIKLIPIPSILQIPISIVIGSIPVEATVAGSGVDHVDFKADNLAGGTTSTYTVSNPPYEWNWNAGPGVYIIAAVAQDSMGNDLGADMVLVLKFF